MADDRLYAIDARQIEALEALSRRLHTEQRMDGDAMRDAGHLLASITRAVRELEVPLPPADASVPEEVDLHGHVDAHGVRYIGRAVRRPNGKYACLADVAGCLCRVEVSITASPATGEGVGRAQGA